MAAGVEAGDVFGVKDPGRRRATGEQMREAPVPVQGPWGQVRPRGPGRACGPTPEGGGFHSGYPDLPSHVAGQPVLKKEVSFCL